LSLLYTLMFSKDEKLRDFYWLGLLVLLIVISI